MPDKKTTDKESLSACTPHDRAPHEHSLNQDTLRLRYQTIEIGAMDIHVRSLRDKQQFSDPLGEAEVLGISSAQWSLFGVVWEASKVLAQHMIDFDIENKRILEVGCGMALSSLLLNKRNADITAMDYHPEAGSFLVENVSLNGGNKIPFLRSDWLHDYPHLGSFDVIIGSDLLYEKAHINALSQFIHRHSKKSCEVIIVDPGRGNHAAFSKKMHALGFQHEQDKPDKLKKTVVLSYTRVQT